MARHQYPSQHPTHKAWRGMMARCYSATDKDYPSIGGAGITVSPEWHSYDRFYADMGDRPEGTIFSRYVRTLGFTLENCYWQPKVQARTNRLYSIWKGIRRRCGVIGTPDPRTTQCYTDRGITMDPDWADDYQVFAEAVGTPPTIKHQIDRIDNDLGYWPGNVRWATAKENANNRSDNVFIEMDGMRRTAQQWCDFYGIPRNTFSARWRALFTIPRAARICAQYDMITGLLIAEYATPTAAAATTGIARGTILKCLSGGNKSAGGFHWHYRNL